ncbi:unnamed protein product [Ectocarpus sp. 12 AP-2014]
MRSLSSARQQHKPCNHPRFSMKPLHDLKPAIFISRGSHPPSVMKQQSVSIKNLQKLLPSKLYARFCHVTALMTVPRTITESCRSTNLPRDLQVAILGNTVVSFANAPAH